jgi:hypothetical protein
MQPLPDVDGTPTTCAPVELSGSGFVGVMVADDGFTTYTAAYCDGNDLVKCTAALMQVVSRELGPEGLLQVILSIPHAKVDTVVVI